MSKGPPPSAPVSGDRRYTERYTERYTGRYPLRRIWGICAAVQWQGQAHRQTAAGAFRQGERATQGQGQLMVIVTAVAIYYQYDTLPGSWLGALT